MTETAWVLSKNFTLQDWRNIRTPEYWNHINSVSVKEYDLIEELYILKYK